MNPEKSGIETAAGKSPMSLSVAYSFEPGLIERLAEIPIVKEIYGKLPMDWIGGGRSSYTMRPVLPGALARAVSQAHRHGITFNYLINAAALYGLEQTRAGQRKIRRTLDKLAEAGVDAVTVSLPHLLAIVKNQYPRMRTRVGVFAQVDSAEKARQWEAMGADTVCLSAIACNRDFDRLASIRAAVQCKLQLIVNASCTPNCAWENTHMHLLSQSSAKGTKNRGFLADYCFVSCSQRRLSDPVAYIKSVWIRPEDLGTYVGLGYTDFKVVERSSPADLIVKRTAAYASGSFDGNLWELIAPVALIKKQQGISWWQKARMLAMIVRPRYLPVASMLGMKRFAEGVIPHDFSKGSAPVYIDNGSLEGFLGGLPQEMCRRAMCSSCGYCDEWADKAVRVDSSWNGRLRSQGQSLINGFADGTFWGRKRFTRETSS
jgi:collagenase-like PrtC family protease